MAARKYAGIIVATAVAYFSLFQLNSYFFSSSGFSEGVNWIFLPSGLRLVFILLFVESGAVGIMGARRSGSVGHRGSLAPFGGKTGAQGLRERPIGSQAPVPLVSVQRLVERSASLLLFPATQMERRLAQAA